MFKVTKVLDRIYLIQFENQYQLCMHFARFQEFYESPKYAKRQFELVDLMEWYSEKFGDGQFTYPKDWGGFNIPSKSIFGCQIKDENRYDRLMKSIAEYMRADADSDEFYIIGARTENNAETVRHEIAHGLFYTNEDYMFDMLFLVDKLPAKFKEKFRNELLKIGYSEDVIEDEMQAYLSTGLLHVMERTGRKHQAPFKKIFNKYYKSIKARKG